MSFISRSWKGETKLWKIFWSGILLPQIIGFLVGFFVSLYVLGSGADKATANESMRNALTSLPWMIGVCIYYILLCICVWRCSFNVKDRPWAYAARTVLIVFIVAMVMNIPMKLGKMHAQEAAQSDNGTQP